MKRFLLTIGWVILGGFAGSFISELLLGFLADATNPTSKWRVLVPVLLGMVVYVFCFSRAFRAWKGEEFFKDDSPEDDENSPIQNKKAFEYVAFFILAILILPSETKVKLIQVIFG